MYSGSFREANANRSSASRLTSAVGKELGWFLCAADRAEARLERNVRSYDYSNRV